MKGCRLAVESGGGGEHLCSLEKSPEGLKQGEAYVRSETRSS